ncbi:hypothetical protein EJ05DRAFT_337882 [Pseudovirgaria hyperparasitica]|uniref:Uncharacterized protein n=1 Tax=Pseudovirgaria hyperparasitica TaxID=470096 RepID=A0A6A6W8N1_9PEZI|nr:uncharacterized protein EJ05DRAFT_337882 [Pseudovirgaria hyperparasitica]KAF2759238.1 hypothetical protein EJ05DRAFT_337882 [Pseudovirgaria hyperparasitica]
MAVDDMRSIMTNVDIRSFLWKLYEMPLPYKGNRYKRRMNALFCEFILRTTEGNIPFTQEEADHFALRCIGWSETGAKPMAEACEPDYKNPIFLAAVALLSLPAENRRVRVIQAALLLTWTIDDEGKQPQQATRLLLVKVLLSLGLGDLAISIWHTLTIKNFVGDAMAHNMFSRISIQHPLAKPCEPYSGGPNKSLRVFRSAREKERTLTRELEASVQYYDRELDKDLLAKGRSLRKFVTDDSKLAVEQSSLPKNKSMGSLSGIIERLNLTLELDHSFSRAMVLLELRRINRMTGDRVVECQIRE